MGGLTLGNSKYRIGGFALIAIVALRVGIGWHFFREGAKKFHDPNFTSAYLLQQAVGPLADFFHRLVPDLYGSERLNRDRTKEKWKQHKSEVARHFGFDEQQNRTAEQVLKDWNGRLDWFFSQNREDINQYFNEVRRLEDNKRDPGLREVPFGRERLTSKQSELRGKLSGWSSQLQSMNQQFHADLYALATDQQKNRGDIEVPGSSKPWVDVAVKYVIISVGVCLILGLLTRIASMAGAVFLASVMATQPPWVPGAQTMVVYYQGVEFLALILLASIGAGKFAGLDLFIHSLRMRCCPPNDIGDEL